MVLLATAVCPLWPVPQWASCGHSKLGLAWHVADSLQAPGSPRLSCHSCQLGHSSNCSLNGIRLLTPEAAKSSLAWEVSVILQPKRHAQYTHAHTHQDPTYILTHSGLQRNQFLSNALLPPASFFIRDFEKGPGEHALFYIKGHSLLWFMISGSCLAACCLPVQRAEAWAGCSSSRCGQQPPPDGIRPDQAESAHLHHLPNPKKAPAETPPPCLCLDLRDSWASRNLSRLLQPGPAKSLLCPAFLHRIPSHRR